MGVAVSFTDLADRACSLTPPLEGRWRCAAGSNLVYSLLIASKSTNRHQERRNVLNLRFDHGAYLPTSKTCLEFDAYIESYCIPQVGELHRFPGESGSGSVVANCIVVEERGLT